jgi:hypothetical protein
MILSLIFRRKLRKFGSVSGRGLLCYKFFTSQRREGSEDKELPLEEKVFHKWERSTLKDWPCDREIHGIWNSKEEIWTICRVNVIYFWRKLNKVCYVCRTDSSFVGVTQETVIVLLLGEWENTQSAQFLVQASQVTHWSTPHCACMFLITKICYCCLVVMHVSGCIHNLLRINAS